MEFALIAGSALLALYFLRSGTSAPTPGVRDGGITDPQWINSAAPPSIDPNGGTGQGGGNTGQAGGQGPTGFRPPPTAPLYSAGPTNTNRSGGF